MKSMLEEVRDRVVRIWEQEGILEEQVRVVTGPLSVEQAIGNPDGSDFPIQKGKERLMEAGIGQARGQAFTDLFGQHEGSLRQVAALPLDNNLHRAVFTAACNASLRGLGRIDHTVHCRDQGPGLCAAALPEYLRSRYNPAKVTIVGFQPAMIEALAKTFALRVLDLDPDNVGQVKRGVLVEGESATDEALGWADLLLITGTTLVNNSIDQLVDHSGRGPGGKPVVFYGTTIAGAAWLMGWDRYCAQST